MDEKPPIRNKEENEKLKQRFLDYSEELLNDYSNEIPVEMLSGLKEKDHKYKVRGNWFISIRNWFTNLEMEKIYFPDDFIEEYKTFFKNFQQSHKPINNVEQRTTKEEIDKADDLLRRAQEYVRNTKI